MADLLIQSPQKLDLEKDRIIKIPMKQFDTRTLVFKIYRNSIAVDLTDWNVNFLVGGSSCYVFQGNTKGVSKNGNTITIECVNNITLLPGEKRADLQLSKNGKVISTFSVILVVEPCALFGIKQEDNIAYTSLKDLLDKLNRAESSITDLINHNKTALEYINTLKSQIAIIQQFGDITAVKNQIDTVNSSLNSHINNQNIHVTKEQKKNWDNHINNQDIHITKSQKDKWDAYEAKIIELTNIIDNILYKDAVVIDDEGNFIIDDEGNTIIV